MPLTFIKSQKGKNMLINKGFLYSIHDVYETKVVWRCTEYKNLSCKSQCHTTTEDETDMYLNLYT